MDSFRKAVKAAMSGATTSITGTATATVGQLTAYIKAKNLAVPDSILGRASLHLSEGAAEGIKEGILPLPSLALKPAILPLPVLLSPWIRTISMEWV